MSIRTCPQNSLWSGITPHVNREDSWKEPREAATPRNLGFRAQNVGAVQTLGGIVALAQPPLGENLFYVSLSRFLFPVPSPGLNIKKNVWEIEMSKTDFSCPGPCLSIRERNPMRANWTSQHPKVRSTPGFPRQGHWLRSAGS